MTVRVAGVCKADYAEWSCTKEGFRREDRVHEVSSIEEGGKE